MARAEKSVQSRKRMEQVQSSNSKSNSNWLMVGVLAAIGLVVLLVGFMVYRGVSNFVAKWQITDLPGMVVSGETEGNQRRVRLACKSREACRKIRSQRPPNLTPVSAHKRGTGPAG